MDIQKITNKKRIGWFLAGLSVIVLVFLLYLLPIKIFHFWDETVYLQNAETMFFGRTNYDELSFRPPLLSLLFGFGFFLWHSAILANIIVAGLAVLAPIFIFFIARKIYGVKEGIIAALLVGFSPFIIQNAHYLYADIPVMSLMAISFYFALFKEKKWFLFLSGIFCSLAILMKFAAALFLPILVFYLLINRIKIKEVLFFGFGAFLTILPYLLWSYIQFGNFLDPFLKGTLFVGQANESNFFYLKNLFIPLTPLAVLGFFSWLAGSAEKLIKLKESLQKEDIFLLFWIILFFAFLVYVPHKEIRYMAVLLVPLALLSSKGLFFALEKIPIKNKIKAQLWTIVCISALLLVAALVYHAYSYQPSIVDKTETELATASNYLIKELNYNGTIYFYIYDDWPVFAYYTGLKTELIPWDNAEGFYSGFYLVMEKGDVLVLNSRTENTPEINWMDNNKEFVLLGNSSVFYFYKYFPD